ncbi:MAG: SAM hydrolase/SAM-dependent halogenase family protein [Bryobacteraceae bacterium]
MEAPNRSPIITLTTDFGLLDHYVGTMKGVVLSRCPEARLIDISHEIAPFSIYAGAYAIDQAAPYFLPGTVHVVVIDPGVGTARKPILAEALGQIFIAPDNGVLSLIFARDRQAKAREITRRDLWLENASATFHGRDIFAATAGAIASGAAKPCEAGPELQEIEKLADLEPVETAAGVWRGRILSVDRFGNAITNFPSSKFTELVLARFCLSIGSHQIRGFRETFGAAEPEECFVYFGSSGYAEIGMNRQNAAERLGAVPGARVHLRLL